MMVETEQGGRVANRSGRWLEDLIYNTLKTQAGYDEITPHEKKMLVRQDGVLRIEDTDKWFCRQLRLERNLYGAKYTSDFYLYDFEKWPDGLHVEAKWQNSSGSIDEKYVFTALSLISFKAPTMMILAGGGARQGAVQWLTQQGRKSGFIFINGLDEFNMWAQRNL
tara:strand:+ start:584 stop:1081 length:498 start_codon:yes stop_codon:yes gene_type:complete